MTPGASQIAATFPSGLDRRAVTSGSMEATLDRASGEPVAARPSPDEILTYLRLTGVLGTSDQAALEEIVPDIEWVAVPAGATPVRQGTVAYALYVVMHWCLRAVLTREDWSEVFVNEVGPGEVVGEIPLLIGGARTASLCAHSPATLLRCPYAACRRLADRAPQVLTALAGLARQRLQRNQIICVLRDLFGPLDATVLCDIAGEARTIHLARGTTLCRQGEAGDRLYVVIRGRL